MILHFVGLLSRIIYTWRRNEQYKVTVKRMLFLFKHNFEWKCLKDSVQTRGSLQFLGPYFGEPRCRRTEI